MVGSVVAAIANIVLNFLLIPCFGYIAAAYTTLVCYMLLAIVHYLFMSKICKENLKVKSVYNDKMFLLITVCFLICMALAMCLYNFVVLRYAILVIAFIVLVIKRDFVINLVKNIKKKD